MNARFHQALISGVKDLSECWEDLMQSDMVDELRINRTLFGKENQLLERHVLLARISWEEVFEERMHIG